MAAKLVNVNFLWVFDIPHASHYLCTCYAFFFFFLSQRSHNFDLAATLPSILNLFSARSKKVQIPFIIYMNTQYFYKQNKLINCYLPAYFSF